MIALKSLLLILFSYNVCILVTNADISALHSVEKRALQKSHEKPQAEKWMDTFFGKNLKYNQVPSLVNLLNTISEHHLDGCSPVILYDRPVENSNDLVLEQLFRAYPVAYMHGQINKNYNVVKNRMLNSLENKCISYIMFMEDVMRCRDVIGAQNVNKVIIVARSSQWRVYEFLATEIAQSFVNLLVIAQSEKITSPQEELPFILYTHELYVDGLGSSTPQVITSWYKGNLTRPSVQLFPEKMKDGFAGHRFIITVTNQPPFVIKRGRDENEDLRWEGSEIRLLKLLAEMYNFTTDFREAKNSELLGSGNAVMMELQSRRADIGIGGLYIVPERIGKVDVSSGHSQDCAAFVSLTSTALPRWRAIMGPFQWTVWLILTLTYLLAIFPLAFSDRHSLKYLLKTPEEMENMFWYVFGTFTNCFSFVGRKSWSKSEKIATRLLIGFYWLFTIIITACYTGSIIAFVTLPVFPTTVDTVRQLLAGRYQIGTLDRGGWEYWFQNSSDPATAKLLKDVELVPTIESGLKNTTSAFFWSYAFLGSRAQLDYLVRTNFTTGSRRSLLHISSECFVPYGVGVTFALNSVYKGILNEGILRAVQTGFMIKFDNDVKWEMMRSATGKLLQVNSGGSLKILSAEDRALALDDTQGMFLLLSFGFVMGGASLLSEWLGGCFNFCRKKRRGSIASSLSSNPRSYDVPTPREKLNSIQYSRSSRMFGSFEDEKIDENDEIQDVEKGKSKCLYPEIPKEDLEPHENNIHYKSVEVEINEIFNFKELFGEENDYDDYNTVEELRNSVHSSRKNSTQ